MSLTEKILNYWHLMETLSPNDFPEPPKPEDNQSLTNIRIGQYLYQDNQWCDVDAGDNIRNAFPELGDQVDTCVGKISKEALIASFFSRLNRKDNRIEEDEGDICLFGFMSDQDDNYIDCSFRISPFIWSLNTLINHQVLEYEVYKDECSNKDYINILKSSKSIEDRITELFKRLSTKYLSFIIDKNAIKMDTVEFWSRFITKEEKDKRQEKIQHESAFMNSFILTDLELVLHNYESNPLIKEYVEILNNPSKERIDIKKDYNELKDILSDEYMPRAKWPCKFSPAIMQQVAINYACKGNKLLSVNGPPGTGKTTLLKEIIAQKIYETAVAISAYDSPDDAFTEYELSQNIDNKQLKKVYKPNSELTKYGMLVCSCNNAAVENISLELPDNSELIDKLYDDNEIKSFYSNDDIYFNKSATKLLKTKNEDLNAWGLISAPLGKSENIFNFVSCCGSELKYRSNENIENKQKSNDFAKAKKEFLKQKEIVEKKLSENKNCICNEYIARLINGDSECQYKNPWEIQDLDIERVRLFNKAIQLRKEFILASKKIRSNLKMLFHLWGYKDKDANDIFFSEDTKYEIFDDLFQTLFLIVPVVSTTFASVGRFLKYMNKAERIGLLIVDEAGQATPQNIIGALFRSKQAMIVGDPMQVEPVVTTPKFFNEAIEDLELENYFNQKESVQTFADKMNPIGSYVISQSSDSERKWVGCPLLVHRRCIEPMFQISNELSYGNTMINQTKPDAEFEKKAMFDKSYWFNIAGNDNGKNHSVEEQAQFVVNTIKAKKTGNSYKVYVISPFSTVVKRINQLLKENEIENISCGTVHKFQGKQAEEVFFVLGCSKKTIGAVNWVNSNIVNVAVTRAKYRIYIVGDYDLWSSNNNFEIAQKLLPLGPLNDLSNQKKKSIKEEINYFVNETISFEKDYNIIITDKLFLIQTESTCWSCHQSTSLYAIAASTYILKTETGAELHTSDSITIFNNITSYDEEFEALISQYKTLQMDDNRYKHLINKCECCNKNQTEQYLFSDDNDKTVFGKTISNDEFELIEIPLENDIQIEGNVFRTIVYEKE